MKRNRLPLAVRLYAGVVVFALALVGVYSVKEAFAPAMTWKDFIGTTISALKADAENETLYLQPWKHKSKP